MNEIVWDAQAVGRYVRTRDGVDGYEPQTLGVIGVARHDEQGRVQLGVYWRPEWQCAGEASPTWYGPGAYRLDDLDLMPPPS